jgi:hypothetical protein
VKRILLIEDDRPFWPRIRDLLGKVNAVVTEARPGTIATAAASGPPDLVVVGDGNLGVLRPEWRSGALLVLQKGRAPDAVVPLGDGERQLVASSSIDARSLLALTSRMLGVSERRLFCAVIGIKREGDGHLHMGASREFSLTGLSFSLAEALRPAEQVVVSFHIPGAGRRVHLRAEIVRSFPDPDDGAACYGARFVHLGDQERDLLKAFVWAEV